MSQRKNYTEEFRQEAVRLLQISGKSARQIGRELGVPQSVLSCWKKQADASETVSNEDQNTNEELRQLRRENARLRMERNIIPTEGGNMRVGAIAVCYSNIASVAR